MGHRETNCSKGFCQFVIPSKVVLTFSIKGSCRMRNFVLCRGFVVRVFVSTLVSFGR